MVPAREGASKASVLFSPSRCHDFGSGRSVWSLRRHYDGSPLRKQKSWEHVVSRQRYSPLDPFGIGFGDVKERNWMDRKSRLALYAFIAAIVAISFLGFVTAFIASRA